MGSWLLVSFAELVPRKTEHRFELFLRRAVESEDQEQNFNQLHLHGAAIRVFVSKDDATSYCLQVNLLIVHIPARLFGSFGRLHSFMAKTFVPNESITFGLL